MKLKQVKSKSKGNNFDGIKRVIVLCLFFLTSIAAYSQNGVVNLELKNADLSKLFDVLEKQTKYKFSYLNVDVKEKEKVSISAKKQQLKSVLTNVLTERGLQYQVMGDKILVSAPNKEQSVQQGIVTGTVKDVSGLPVIGATVMEKGTTNGVSSDMNGKFSFKIAKGSILQISYIGYITQEIKIESEKDITVTLEEDSQLLDEIIVIGYGTKTKSTLTGSVSVIGKEMLENRPVAKTTDLLQGAASGVLIRRSNAGRIRGTNSDISIRGTISRSSPGVLVVIDGIAQKDNGTYALDNISPDDIESINILKDAQAAIYGARAAGGVIIVTTKRGESDKPTINFSANYTMQKPSLMRKSTNILQIVEMMNEGYVNDGQNVNPYSHIVDYIAENNLTMDEISKNNGKYSTQWPFDNSANFVFGDYDWPDIMFDLAPMQNYNLSVSGKTDKLNYYNSIGYVNQESMLNFANNSNQRIFVKLKNDYKITDFLKVKTNFDFERQKVTEPTSYTDVEFWQGLIWPVFMPYNDMGNLYNFGSHQNPIGYARDAGDLTDLNYRIKALMGVVITPLKDLTITAEYSASFDINEHEWSRIGFDMYNEDNKYSYNSRSGRNSAGTSYGRSRYSVANIFANYNYTLLRKHKFDFMLGYSHEEEDYRKFSAERRLGLIGDILPSMGLGSSDEQYNSEEKSDRALNSVFSRIGYTYNNRYLLEATFRRDGSSRFSEENRWASFYGVSGAWNISNEKFMSQLNGVFDLLKIRMSWGQMGNESSIGLYDYIAQIKIDGNYPLGNTLSPTQTQQATLAGLASDTRSWEKIEATNLGLDLSVLNSRLSVSAELYIKNNPNMFYVKEFPEVLGVAAPSINGAHVQAKGWEINLNWSDKIKDFGYSFGFNLSNNTSKVVELADASIPKHGYNQFVEGYSVGSYFAYKFDGFISDEGDLGNYNSKFTSGIPNNLTVGNSKFKDLDGDGKLRPQLYELDSDGNPTENSGDLVHIGDEGQHYLFGINVGANWKNFDFGMFFQGVLKWQVMESNMPIHNNSWPPHDYFYGETWTPENTTSLHPRLSQNGGVQGYDYQASDASYKFYNNRYIRLKNIQIGYTVPKSLLNSINIEKVRVYFSGADLWESYSIPGTYDPEKPFNPRVTPFPRSFSFGVNLTL